MKTVRMVRHEKSKEGTFGTITTPKGKTYFTGELPWEENKAQVSCIPAGRYQCHWSWSPRFKRKVYSVFPVTSRAGIRIHSANFMGRRASGLKSQLNGCIALGTKLGRMEGQKCLLLSVVAVREFERAMGGEPFFLEITE